jgi:ribosome-associated translation inhibitor RaiA
MTLELGGNISLVGFQDRDFTELIVVKKMVGQYVRKLSECLPKFSELKVTLKTVHNSKVELHTHATFVGKSLTSEETSNNLYIALDRSLKKLLEQAQKHQELLNTH